MISRERATGLSDEFRAGFQRGMTEDSAWVLLRETEPDANVFERRRILARAKQCLAVFAAVADDNPPSKLNILYPLPPSTEAARAYLLETVWVIDLDVGGTIKPRTLIVVVPNGSLWDSVLAELVEAVEEMASDYDAEDEPDVHFLLVR